MDEADQYRRMLEELTEEALASSPTEPGLYRLPCGECYVDYFLTPRRRRTLAYPGRGAHLHAAVDRRDLAR